MANLYRLLLNSAVNVAKIVLDLHKTNVIDYVILQKQKKKKKNTHTNEAYSSNSLI